MKNNFDLRKFLTENKNITEEVTEDKFADSAEEDLIQCVKNLGHTRYLSKEETVDTAIAIIEKYFLDKEDDEEMDEQLNESPGDIQDLVHGILGAGAASAAVYGVGKLIDALESGKWREEGIKIAKALRDLSKKKKNEELHSEEVKKK